MKLVTAIIQSEVLEQVQKALIRHGVGGMTISEVSGYGRQQGHIEVYRGEEYTIDFIVKVRLEILVDDPEVDDVVHQVFSLDDVNLGYDKLRAGTMSGRGIVDMSL